MAVQNKIYSQPYGLRAVTPCRFWTVIPTFRRALQFFICISAGVHFNDDISGSYYRVSNNFKTVNWEGMEGIGRDLI